MTSVERHPLAEALTDRLRGAGALDADDSGLVLAFSGGLDSCVLLHLLRFGVPGRPHVVAAHFDHRMRPDSERDASWAHGVCRAWGVLFVGGVAESIPSSEASARTARYAFLRSVLEERGARWILTAHHADDQAETVLFRTLRGTGLAGLSGIPAVRPPDVVRPLLHFSREMLEEYASDVGVRWREDPTNEHLGHARNLLRHEVIPAVESAFAPGARRALVRLSDRARENEEAWASVLPALITGLAATRQTDRTSVDRDALLELVPALRVRVLAHLAAELELRPGEAFDRVARDFVVSGDSGARVTVGGMVIARELDRIVIGVDVRPHPADAPLVVPDAGPGAGTAWLAGAEIPVAWGGAEQGESFTVSDLAFPLVVRARQDGDRIRTHVGTKKLKKLLLEARIPSMERGRIPVLAEQGGRVLWVPGVARTTEVGSENGETLQIRIGE